MLSFAEVDEKYYKKFRKNIAMPFGFQGEKEKQKYYQEILKCIEESREFDGEKYFKKLSDDCVI